jgi:hypothetical protein
MAVGLDPLGLHRSRHVTPRVRAQATHHVCLPQSVRPSRRSSVLVPYKQGPKLCARGVVPKLCARAIWLHVPPNVASCRSSVLVPYGLGPKLRARGVVPKLRASAVHTGPMKLLSVRCWWRAPRRPPTRIQRGSSPPVTKHHMAPQSSNNKQVSFVAFT